MSHKQRAGLWISMCMEHETIVGFHIMSRGEGRRDGIVPPYRFMEKPPKAFFGDYVCGWEETAMNTLPEFYKLVLFFHDIFHGCTHSCSERFESRRLSAFCAINTSLMEQVPKSTQLEYLKNKHKPNCAELVTSGEQLLTTVTRFSKKWNY
jgi:hypothetical protein